MIPKLKVLEKEMVSLPEVKEILKKRKKKDKEMTFEQKIAYKHTKKFAILNKAKADELMNKLENLDIRQLKRKSIVTIVNVLPKNESEVELITNKGTNSNLKKEEIKKVFEIIKDYI